VRQDVSKKMNSDVLLAFSLDRCMSLDILILSSHLNSSKSRKVGRSCIVLQIAIVHMLSFKKCEAQ